jgi:hypothetical protein
MGREATRVHSFATDLTPDQDAIYARLGKHCQAEVQRARREPGLTVDAAHRARSTDEVERMLDFHTSFAQGRGLPAADRRHVMAIAAEGRMLLSSASLNGEDLVWHSYIATEGRVARGLQTGSPRRSADPKARRVISRTNRLLHWADMVALKQSAFETMDWGGRFLSEDNPQHKGVNDFKRDFGAVPVEYVEAFEPLTLRGELYLRARSAVRRFRASLGQPAERKALGKDEVAA